MNDLFKCPICNGAMTERVGDRVFPTNGITMICLNNNCGCPENVEGHGKNAKDAFEVVKQKYKKD